MGRRPHHHLLLIGAGADHLVTIAATAAATTTTTATRTIPITTQQRRQHGLSSVPICPNSTPYKLKPTCFNPTTSGTYEIYATTRHVVRD